MQRRRANQRFSCWVSRLAPVLVAFLLAVSCTGGETSTAELIAQRADLDALYEDCVRAGGLEVSAQVLLADDGVPRHVKTSPEVPAGIHGKCFELIGGSATSGSSWSVEGGAVLPSAPPPEPSPLVSPTPPPTVGSIAEPEPGATALLGRSPEGFDYMIAYSRPDGRGNGQIQVRKPTGELGPALLDEDLLLPMVHDMKFGPNGLVGFASGHFNYGTLIFVGRRDEAGQIRDLHRLGESLYGSPRPSTIDRFEQDGRLIAGDFVLDTNTDPRFVNTATTPPAIETTMLTASVDDDRGRPSGAWHLGETLGEDPACGSSTLYRNVPDGWERVLDPTTELGTVVAVHATELKGIGGVDTVGVGREVVLATECPAEYDGQHLYWGQDGVDYGDGGPALVHALRPLRIENLVVGQVLSVTPIAGDPWGNVSDLVLKVRTLEGEIATLGVTRVGATDWRAVASVRPPLDDDTIDAVPLGRLDEAAWLIQSAATPDRLVRVDPLTGDVVETIWEEHSERGVRGEEPLGGQSLDCPGRNADGQFQLVQVFYELSGALLDQVTVTEIIDREIVKEQTSPINGGAVPYAMSHVCGRPRLPPPSITALQLENLLDLAGFTEVAFDHPIDPTATATATWEGEQHLFTLDHSIKPLNLGNQTNLPCLMGALFIDPELPDPAKSTLKETCTK